MNAARLAGLLRRFPSKRVAVVGDFFLDKYLAFDPGLAEESIETGKVANQVVEVRHTPGAAGAVVANLVSLGAGRVVAVGFTGDDGEGYELRKDLASLGCQTDLLFAVHGRHTPTYLKPCNVKVPGLDGEAERYDTKNRMPLSADLQSQLVGAMEDVCESVDAVIVADQVVEAECGVVTATMRAALAQAASSRPDVVFFADSRGRIGLFGNIAIKPNQFEAVAAVGRADLPLTDEHVVAAGLELHSRVGKPVFVTMSERGMLVFQNAAATAVPGVEVPAPIDSTGAGDSATAGAVLTLASGGLAEEAALVANLVASITVQQLGVTGVARPEQLPGRLERWLAQNDARPR